MHKQTKEVWQGPLPSPQTMEEFRQIGSDWPERIFKQWETETAHRRGYENRALDASILIDKMGQVFAGIFAGGALGVAALAIVYGQPWVASIIGGATIASVVGAFLHRDKKKKEQNG